MFAIHSSTGYQPLIPGIRIKTLCYGQSTLMAEFYLEKGALIPEHAHFHEQTGYLVEGKIRFFIDGISKELSAGDSWNVPGNSNHRVEVLEDSFVIEVFSPVREDYLPYLPVENQNQ
jgi:quercetin dioxygenase-like cupin family protein